MSPEIKSLKEVNIPVVMLLRTIFSPLEIDMRNSPLTIITHKLIEGAAKIFTAADLHSKAN